ncbi:MAG: BrnT family toxin [Sandaracinaceae bacterium]|nr:BrnT family toxin [Sandaracinaceae bacterium]
MRLEWDPAKDEANRAKHGIGFAEASELLTSGVECLEIYDQEHSDDEDRFISVGPISRGLASSSGRSATRRRFGS